MNDKDKAKEILQDIELLQLSNSPSLFELGTTLFMKKMEAQQQRKKSINIRFFTVF